MAMVINGKVYRDLVDISLAEFWKMFTELHVEPTTNGANMGDFVTIFNDLSQTTDNIVCILVSKAMTVTHESAYQARKIVKSEKPHLNIEIIDSKTSAGAMGYIVLEAARAAWEGKSFKEVCQVARDMVPKVIYVCALDTLKHMIRIGRAPRNSGAIGDFLQVKPIVGFIDDTGWMEVIARVRGKQKSLTKLVELVEKYIDIRKPLHVMIHYSDSKEEGETVRQMISSKYKCAEIYMSEYTPVMVSATGPVVGLAFYS